MPKSRNIKNKGWLGLSNQRLSIKKLSVVVVLIFFFAFLFIFPPTLNKLGDRKNFSAIENDVSGVQILIENNGINKLPPATRDCRQAVEKYGGGYWWCSVGFDLPVKDKASYESSLRIFRSKVNEQGAFGKEQVIREKHEGTELYFESNYLSQVNGRICGISGRFEDDQKIVSFGCQMRVKKPLF